MFVQRNQRKGEFAFAAELPVNLQFGGAEEKLAGGAVPSVRELAGDLAYIAGLDGRFKTHLVQAGLQGHVARDFILHQDGTALGHDLTLDDSRNDRVAGKVAPGEEFVLLDGVFGVAFAVFVNIGFLNQEHGLTMGEELFDFFFVHLVRV